MKLIYNIGIAIYSLLIKLVSNFNKKAELRDKGAKTTIKILKTLQSINEKKIWLHCASLGEFEQGRPFIENIKKMYPEYKIILTFFSPSGYEVRKNYEQADFIFYLPNDTKKNAELFIQTLKPEIAVFVKYEFWYNYLNCLKKNKIPVYLISGIFRNNQIFFKFYGGFYRKLLSNFEHLFVQNQTSLNLMKLINIQNVSLTGDTRFDRVFEIARNPIEIPLIEEFKNNQITIVAGSTWLPDEEILFNYINSINFKIKLIIAPHEIHSENISRIVKLSKKKILKYSEATSENIKESEILIIDSIGILSFLYRYADISYIGGGFGVGIHNTLEAAVYGIPIIFGPKYQKFDEATELISRKAAFTIKNQLEFENVITSMINNKTIRETTGLNSKQYVETQLGATSKIINAINF